MTAVTISTQVYTDGTSTDDPHLTTVPAQVVDYVPCYRSLAGTGNAMGFVYWRPQERQDNRS